MIHTHTTALSVQGLQVSYGATQALQDISFDVAAGQRLAIIGPNGAGKSTLLMAVAGLLRPQGGSISLYGHQPGYVPQHENVDLSFPVTVYDVVMMGLVRQIGWLRWPGAPQRALVQQALERVGMADYSGRQIGELSGGQRRRVFIARALAQQSDMLLLDEPFAGVDAGAQAGLMEVLNTLHSQGMTIILSTHDLALAFQQFDRVMALRERIIAHGRPQEVYRPEVLAALYGGAVAAFEDEKLTVFVDEHGCEGC